MIRVAVNEGITDIGEIRDRYNEYARGWHIDYINKYEYGGDKNKKGGRVRIKKSDVREPIRLLPNYNLQPLGSSLVPYQRPTRQQAAAMGAVGGAVSMLPIPGAQYVGAALSFDDLAYDLEDMWKNPSWQNAAHLALDIPTGISKYNFDEWTTLGGIADDSYSAISGRDVFGDAQNTINGNNYVYRRTLPTVTIIGKDRRKKK